MPANPYETAGRAKKVSALVSALDAWASARSMDPRREAFADALAIADEKWWQDIAKNAGVNAPSATSVQEVIVEFRMRSRPHPDSRPRVLYRLPDGGVVSIIFDRGDQRPLSVSFQLADGRVVFAKRLEVVR